MNRDFVYDHRGDRPGPWSRVGTTLNKLFWRVLCCGEPGRPCGYCQCCVKPDTVVFGTVRDEATATADRVVRQHRPHAPGGRKSTPEMLSAVRCALSQLQGDSVPTQAPTPPMSEGDRRGDRRDDGRDKYINPVKF